MHTLNVSMGEGTDYMAPGTIRPTKCKGTRLGFKKDPSKKIKPMKFMSKKQRKRTDVLDEKLEVILKIQEKMYEHRFCMASLGADGWKHKCPGHFKLLADHVTTRNQFNADRYGNLQPICSWCNHQKASLRIDFRPVDYKIELMKLDK